MRILKHFFPYWKDTRKIKLRWGNISMKRIWGKILVVFLLSVLFCRVVWAEDRNMIRIGFFPNLTHAHALVLQNLAREGKAELFPPGLELEWKAFNAGPSAMEAIYADAVDMTYVGPSPVLNAFIRAGAEGVRVLAGATRGGAGLVVHTGSGLRVPEDFRGKRIATPQLGNTQDVACRNWLLSAGLKVTLGGGDVRVIPTANPDQLPLFVSGHVDGVWTVEPWLSRLLGEGGELVFSEPVESCIVTVLAVRDESLEQKSERVRQVLALHEAVNAWMLEHPEEARRRVADELSRITRREFPLSLVEAAWPRMVFRTDISSSDFMASYVAARRAGFLKRDDNVESLLEGIVKIGTENDGERGQ